jgi:hypothetical protein
LRFFAPLFVAILASFTAVADDGNGCKRPELEWQTWRAHVKRTNPGVQFGEIVGDQRNHLIDAYNAGSAPPRFNPDRVVLCYCAGRTRVLLVFLRGGCVTMAEDMPIADLHSLVSGGIPR